MNVAIMSGLPENIIAHAKRKSLEFDIKMAQLSKKVSVSKN